MRHLGNDFDRDFDKNFNRVGNAMKMIVLVQAVLFLAFISFLIWVSGEVIELIRDSL